jgi:hypothetical protein
MKDTRLAFLLPNSRYKPETEEIRDWLIFNHVLVAFPSKETPAENTRTETSFQEVRKNVKIYLLKTNICQSFSVLLGVGVECVLGSSALGFEI